MDDGKIEEILEDEDLEDIIAHFEDFFPNSLTVDETIKEMCSNLQNLQLQDLSYLCKEQNLPYSGSKKLLIERILNYERFKLEWKEPGSNFNFKSSSKTFSSSSIKNIPSSSTPFDIFSKFFTPLLIQDFVEEVNIILTKCKIDENPLETTPHLIYGFFALILETSFNHKNDLKNYHDGSNLFFMDLGISRNKWLKLVRSLWHISNEFFELFSSSLIINFSNYYAPHKNIAIDETVRRFKGWFGSKVYAPDKPAKFGLKYYSMVDKNGYILWFKLYRKRKKYEIPETEDNVTLALCKEAINHLLSFNPGVSFHIFADNYYGSLSLAKFLLEKKYDLTLALKSNRVETSSYIAEMKKTVKNTEVGEFSCRINADETLALGIWKDKG